MHEQEPAHALKTQLGLAYQAARLGDAHAALAAFERALATAPHDPGVCATVGGHLLRVNLDTRRAVTLLTAAARALPNGAEVWCDLGLARLRVGEIPGALAALARAAELAPTNPAPWANRAVALRSLGQHAQATLALDEALARAPQNPDLHVQRGETLLLADELTAALSAYERALDLRPTHSVARARAAWIARKLCDWDAGAALDAAVAADTASSLARGEAPAEDPWIHLGRVDDPVENRQVAEAWSRRLTNRSGAPASRARPAGSGLAGGRMRIGYLSSDWFHHATAQLLVGVLEAHDRDRVEVIAYSHGPVPASAMQARVQAAVDRFVDITLLSDRDAAAAIVADGVDVLVDLKGYTHGHRLGVLTWRPAPVIVAWLGHPGTSGLNAVDWILADDTVIPPADLAHVSERVAYLPHTYQPNDPARPVPPAMSRALPDLPQDAVVLGSFNDPWKIDPATFDRWCAVLRAVPETVLWALVHSPHTVDRFRRRAADIDPARIRGARRLPWRQHLSRVQCADLAMDTARVNGHTTTSELLWCGVPVVAHAGDGFAARVSVSLLAAAGVPELIAPDGDGAVDIAITLARDRARLKRLHQRLVSTRGVAPLWDATAFARHLEALYAQMLENPSGTGPLRVSL